MKQRIEINADPRQPGKHFSRAHRVQKMVPAILYGASKNVNLLLSEKEVTKYNTRAFENALFNLKSSDKEADGKVALMKSIDVHPLSRRPLHVDLYALDLKKAVRVFVEIKPEGKPEGVAEGGLLSIINREIEVECLPTEIPDSISADVTHLGVGDALHVSDLKVPSNVKIISNPGLTVAVVTVIEEEVIAAPTAAATDAAAGAAAPGAAGAAAPGAAGAAAPGAAGAAAPGAAGKDAKAPAAAGAKDAKAPAGGDKKK